MTNPGSIGSRMPLGEDWIVRELAAIRQEMREGFAAQTLSAATIDAAAGKGIRTSDFDGTDANNPGTQGNYFGGDIAILSKLLLRDGAILNNWLAKPLAIGQGNNNATGFALPATETEIVGFNLTVPTGYSQMLALAEGDIFAVNDRTAADYIMSRCWIDSYYGDVIPSVPAAASGGPTQKTSAKQGLLTGLTAGSTVRLSLRAYGNGGSWSANAGNVASLVGIVIWLV